MRQKAELEQDVVAIERIEQYVATDHEAPYIIENKRPPRAWPQHGKIEFKNVYMKYRPGLKHVLKGIFFLSFTLQLLFYLLQWCFF